MAQIAENFKKISTLKMPGTGKLIALAILEHDTLDVKRLVEITGETVRVVQMYRAMYLTVQAESETDETREADFAKFAKDAKPVSCDDHGTVQPHIEEHARLNETPSELSSPKVEDKTSLSEVPSDLPAKPKARARRRFAYTTEFEAFWTAYPDTSNNSKQEAFAEWLHLLPAEHTLATDGLKHLAAHCRKNPDYRCVHACRYLKQRRWESYQPKPIAKPISIPTVRPDFDPVEDALRRSGFIQ